MISTTEPIVFWKDIFSGFEHRIEIASNGIFKDRYLDLNNKQKSEYVERDSVAKRFLNLPREAFKEAIKHHSFWVMRQKAYQAVKSLLSCSEKRNAILADLGCGFGWYWIDLAKEFNWVKFLLIDFSEANLRICRSLMPFGAYPNVLCLQCDITDIPIQNNISDFCWSVQVLQHLPQEKRKIAFKEIIRVQKKDAPFYIAWLRSVPLARLIYSIFGKRYHKKGYLENGVFLQRFDQEIKSELRSLFTNFRLRYSETLFHRDFKITPRSKLAGNLDLMVGRTFLAHFLARQVEVSGKTN